MAWRKSEGQVKYCFGTYNANIFIESSTAHKTVRPRLHYFGLNIGFFPKGASGSLGYLVSLVWVIRPSAAR